MLLPSELWDRVLEHVRDPLDLYALWQTMPDEVAHRALQDPLRKLPAAWVSSEDVLRVRAELGASPGTPGTRGTVRLNEPLEPTWTSVRCRIPIPDMTPLAPRLEALEATDGENSVCSPAHLAWLAQNCPNLRQLTIVSATVPVDALGGLRGLRSLHLASCSIQSSLALTTVLAQLTDLTELNLAYNPIAWSEVVSALPAENALTKLRLDGLGAPGVDAAAVEALLTRCPSLTSLSIDYTHWTDADAWSRLQWRDWEELSMRGCSWDQTPKPTRLRTKKLRVSFLGTHVLAALLPDGSWRELEVNYTHVPPSWLEIVAATARHLSSLSCVGCIGLTSAVMNPLLPLFPQLRDLQIDHTYIGIIPFHAGLERLSVGGSPFRTECLSSLPALRRLVLGAHPQSGINHHELAAWVRTDPWYHHIWFRTHAQQSLFLRNYPDCEGSVHVQQDRT